MTTIFRAKINIGNNYIELEGSENFVSKYLDSFKDELLQETPAVEAPVKATVPKRSKREKPQEKTEKRAKRKSKSIESESFDISKTAKSPSLETFMNEKAPGKGAGNRMAVIAYYLKHHKGQAYFTEGNIDYAYKALGLKGKPVHLRQIIVNEKNRRALFEEANDGQAWALSRAGEIFVEEKLPPKDEE